MGVVVFFVCHKVLRPWFALSLSGCNLACKVLRSADDHNPKSKVKCVKPQRYHIRPCVHTTWSHRGSSQYAHKIPLSRCELCVLVYAKTEVRPPRLPLNERERERKAQEREKGPPLLPLSLSSRGALGAVFLHMQLSLAVEETS